MRTAAPAGTRAHGFSVIEMLFAMAVIAAIGSLTAAGIGRPHEPSGSGDFGNTHTSGIAFGQAKKVTFNSDGTLVDETRRPRSGTVFSGFQTSRSRSAPSP